MPDNCRDLKLRLDAENLIEVLKQKGFFSSAWELHKALHNHLDDFSADSRNKLQALFTKHFSGLRNGNEKDTDSLRVD